jgi:RNA polymerase sigma-70 factor (ECF subfamily)
VVTLYYYQERAVQQVAEALGMPEGTVKTHLHRARAALRGLWLKARAVEAPGSSPQPEETNP